MDHILGNALHTVDFQRNLIRGLRNLRGEVFDLAGNNREAFTVLTCAGGLKSTRDCSKLLPSGMGCGFTPTGMATCGPVGTACQFDDGETCENGTIGYCSMTGPATLDCKALGYTGCKKTELGERTVASCTK